MKIVLLLLTLLALGIGFSLQFSGWFSHSLITEGESEITKITVTYNLDYYENEKLVYKKSEGEGKASRCITSNFYTQQQEFCSMCGTNDWCHGQCGVYNILLPVYFLNIFVIIFLILDLAVLALFILFERRRYDNKNVFNIMYWFITLTTFVGGSMIFIFDVIACRRWQTLKDSQPIPYYQNNSIIIPIIGFCYAVLLFSLGIMNSFNYYKYRNPKSARTSRRDSFL